ncbi:MAG: 30S ribosomal protein S16 [bacterium]
MLKIRLQRTGRKNVPTFRIVLTDSKNSTKSGKFIEILGNHDPRNDKGDVKADRVKYWMSQGAQLTGTLHNLFISKGVIKGDKVNKLPKKTPEKKEGEAVAPKA